MSFKITKKRKEPPTEETNGWKCLPSRKARVVAVDRDIGRPSVLRELFLTCTTSHTTSLICAMKTTCFTVSVLFQ